MPCHDLGEVGKYNYNNRIQYEIYFDNHVITGDWRANRGPDQGPQRGCAHQLQPVEAEEGKRHDSRGRHWLHRC